MTTPYSTYGTGNANHTPYSPNPTQSTPIQTQTPAQFASVLSSAHFDSQNQPGTPTPAGGRGRGRGGTGAKRGRKPKGAIIAGSASPRPFMTSTFSSNGTSTPSAASTSTSFPTTGASAQYPRVHWAMPNSNTGGGEGAGGPSTSDATSAAPGVGSIGSTPADGASRLTPVGDPANTSTGHVEDPSTAPSIVIDPALTGAGGMVGTSSQRGTPVPDLSTGLAFFPARGTPQPPNVGGRAGAIAVDEEVEGDDELLPAMADDDYSAQLSWQSQSKDNLKVLMDNLSPAQYDRFEAYRRHALPKQAVRKVIQQSLGQQVSQPVAQIIAGFSKVFVGEIVEKARAVQSRRGETGPLSPDHLREAYRAYQEETGHVGAARPLRAKKLFVR